MAMLSSAELRREKRQVRSLVKEASVILRRGDVQRAWLVFSHALTPLLELGVRCWRSREGRPEVYFRRMIDLVNQAAEGFRPRIKEISPTEVVSSEVTSLGFILCLQKGELCDAARAVLEAEYLQESLYDYQEMEYRLAVALWRWLPFQASEVKLPREDPLFSQTYHTYGETWHASLSEDKESFLDGVGRCSQLYREREKKWPDSKLYDGGGEQNSEMVDFRLGAIIAASSNTPRSCPEVAGCHYPWFLVDGEYDDTWEARDGVLWRIRNLFRP